MTTVPQSWRPLLTGAAAARAREAIDAIADDLIHKTEKQPTAGLGGRTGYAIFFAYLALQSGDDRYADLVVEHHAEALTALETRPLPLSLYGGQTGIGWMDAHLARVFFAEEDSAVTWDGVGDALLDALEAVPWQHHYDLISGLAGYAVYALERLPHPAARRCVEAIVARLTELARVADQGATWITPAAWLAAECGDDCPEGACNVGVAHGAPGVIGMLATAVEAGIDDAQTRALLRRATRWVLAQRADTSRTSFPSWVFPDGRRMPARTAWCYGDPGIAAVLMRAARALGDENYTAAATEIALRAAAVPFESTEVNDAGLCHGAAGLAHIYLRLFRLTGIPAFEQAACRWFGHVLDMRRPEEGIGGFLSWGPPFDSPSARWRHERTWRRDATFLTGAAGIGLALLAATSTVPPAWDRLLLIS